MGRQSKRIRVANLRKECRLLAMEKWLSDNGCSPQPRVAGQHIVSRCPYHRGDLWSFRVFYGSGLICGCSICHVTHWHLVREFPELRYLLEVEEEVHV